MIGSRHEDVLADLDCNYNWKASRAGINNAQRTNLCYNPQYLKFFAFENHLFSVIHFVLLLEQSIISSQCSKTLNEKAMALRGQRFFFIQQTRPTAQLTFV